MHVGKDPGLLPVVLVVVVVVVLVIGLFIKRRLRHVAERNEEVKRLLSFASEEAARAEVTQTYYNYNYTSSYSVSSSSGIPAVYKCAVCFAPTSTRCSKCKAVRYCSGRCQIAHWFQGHKEECRPYVAVKPVTDESGSSSKQWDGKVFNDSLPTEKSHDGLHHKDHAAVPSQAHQPEIGSFSQSAAESSSEEYSTFSTRSRSSTETSSSSSGDSHRMDTHQFADVTSENLIPPARKSTSSEKINQKKTNLGDEDVKPRFPGSSSRSDRMDTHQFADVTSENLISPARKSTSAEKINQNKTNLSDEDVNPRFSSSSSRSYRMDTHQFADVTSENLISPARKSTSAGKINQNKVNLSDEDVKPMFSSSSSRANRMDTHQFADVTSENMVSPARKCTSSGKINQSKVNLSDEDVNRRFSSSSSHADDGSSGSSSSEPSTSYSDFWSGTINYAKSTFEEMDGFETSASSKAVTESTTILDNSSSYGLGNKKSNNKTPSSNEMLIEGFKSTRPPKYTSETLKRRVVVAGSDLSRSILKETKNTPSGAVEHSVYIDSKAFGVMPPAISERSDDVVRKSITSPAFKSTSRLTSEYTKPVTVHEEKNRVATSSSKLTENTGSARNGLKASMQKVVDQFKPSKLSSSHSSLKAETETAYRYSYKGLFSYEMFVKLYNWKQVELRPFGLINCGNSCYANAVLQCLTYTPPLNAYLLQALHSKTCKKIDWCFTCEFEGLILKSKNGNSPLSPSRILSRIENLGHGREEDAHEFLRYAINTLQSVCLKEAGTNTPNSLEEETTLIGLAFGGYLRSKIRCMKCGVKSERHERMMDLTVEIEGNIGTLEEALNKFTSTETLDGENKYKCSRCKSYERAKKKLTLLEAPNVLTIALKRFQSGKFGKLNKSVHFPEILDMAPYMSGTSDMSPVYRLYGVVVHLDINNAAFAGHYVCYVKNIENRWFKIDDSKVKEVNVQSVLTKGAYMLLYARCSPRAPRILLRSLHDPKKHKVATSLTSRSHSTEPWDMNTICHRTVEEESSSSSDSSGLFSETCSSSWDREPELNMSSDSDTSSSSSFPSPLHTSHSPLSTLNNHSTLRERSRSYNGGPGILYHDDQYRKLSSSSSCREANIDRLGGRPTNL